MAFDPGAKAVEELIEKLAKRFNTQYKQAVKESTKKLKDFLKDFDQKNKEKKSKVDAGELSPDEYKDWLRSQAVKKQYLQEMVNTLSADAVLCDVKAMSAVRGYMQEAYAINLNYGAYQVESGALIRTSFTLYDRSTVERLIRDKPNVLPEPKPDIPKEMRWHKQKLTNAITQGILQGESIPKIATRLQEVTDMDRRAAIRNARTAMTGAQNAGRVDSYKFAESLGIELEQEWLATLDGHTRDSHREMDGERAAVGTAFSNGCLYPGDPYGAPAEIYNCRCTLVPVLAELDQSKADRYSKLGDMDYEEWKWGKEDPELRKVTHNLKAAQTRFSQMENKVYSDIWKDDVKLSQYQEKADSIQAKRDYYEKQLGKLPPDSAKYAEFQDKLKQLNEFERLGKKYVAAQKDVANLSLQFAKLGGDDGNPFGVAAYDAMRKQLAQSFGTLEEADKYFRPLLDAQWDKLTDEEKYAVWKYTENSNPLNKPLSGYEETWDRYNFKGVGKTNWSYEDKYSHRINPSQFKKFGHANGHIDHAAAIRDLTMGIEKTTLTDDVWLARSSDKNGLAGLLEGNLISFNDAKYLLDHGKIDELRAIIQNQEFQSHAFMPTGVTRSVGDLDAFSGGVKYRIYAPRGTKAIYAEPQSHWGGTIGKEKSGWYSKEDDRLYKPGMSYSKVGSQAEVIIQRGTGYRITDMKYNAKGELEVSMEIAYQPEYFKTGFEYTHNNGETSFAYKGK